MPWENLEFEIALEFARLIHPVPTPQDGGLSFHSVHGRGQDAECIGRVETATSGLVSLTLPELAERLGEPLTRGRGVAWGRALRTLGWTCRQTRAIRSLYERANPVRSPTAVLT